MQPGDLVKITRKSIGVPAGTIGLITKVEFPLDNGNPFKLLYYSVQLYGLEKPRERRYLREALRPI